jgi:hypothetical protein
MNNPLLFISPAVNVLVTGLFAGVVLRQYLARRRPYQLYWSIALGMAFAATIAYITMILLQPTSSVGIFCFRVYYALGGSIMPAWLGLGSVALVSSTRISRIGASVLGLLSILAVVLVFSANINLPHLRQIAGTPGTGTLEPGAWLVMTIVLNTLGVVAVAGIALYSGWKLLRRQNDIEGQRTSTILRANLLIFGGAILDAIAGSLARFLNFQSSFWLIMAVGWIILFGGVLLASKRPQANSANAVSNKQTKSETMSV